MININMIDKYFCVTKLKGNQYYITTNFWKLVVGLNNFIPLTPFQKSLNVWQFFLLYVLSVYIFFFCLSSMLYIYFLYFFLSYYSCLLFFFLYIFEMNI